MKRITLFTAALAALSMLASCQKEQLIEKPADATGVTEFTATIEQPTKTAIAADGKVSWTAGDEITVTDAASKSAVYVAKSAGASTKFALKDDQTAVGAGPYTATYGDIAEQVYDAAGANCPLTASQTVTTSFTFSSPYAVVKITAKSGQGEVIRSVDVTYGGNKSFLDCKEGVTLTSEGKDFYVAVLPATDAALSVTFHTADKMAKKTRKSAATLTARNLLPVTFSFTENDWNVASLPGGFSISATKQVKFSRGNLYVSNGLWDFYLNQYDHGTKPDLFTWGYGDWSTDITRTEYVTAHSKGEVLTADEDWASRIGDGSLWRTLTSSEWKYLISERDGAVDKCRNGITVCGQANCLVIAPDSFAGSIEDSYDFASWAIAEEDGLVCLPPTGLYQNGNRTKEDFGYYWSSTAASDTTAHYFSFGPKVAPKLATKLAAGRPLKNLSLDRKYTVKSSPILKSDKRAVQKSVTPINDKQLQRTITSSAVEKKSPNSIPALAARYDAAGKVSTDGGASWSDELAWVATVGVDAYGPAITNLIPKGPFVNPIALNYEARESQIVIPATPLTQISENEIVFAADINDFLNGGTGDIVLNVAQDGSLSLPEASKNHIIGYFRATFDSNTYTPKEMTGIYHLYKGLTYSIAQPITERDTLNFSGSIAEISQSTDGWLYQLEDDDTGYIFLLQSTVATDKYGTFSYADGTLGSGYYNVYDPQGGMQQFVEGSITVGEVDDNIILDGVLVAQDEKAYVLHFTQPANVLSYDTDAPFDATFAYHDMSAFIDKGVINISATNAENKTLDLELYTGLETKEIPAGTYEINDSKEAGTALKSIGVSNGLLTMCLATTYDADGYYSGFWFLVDGTVTLSYDEYDKLKVEVDGKNSWGQPVTALVKYERITPKNTVNIDDIDLCIYDGFLERYGVMNFYGDTYNYGFDLYADTDRQVGDFLDAINLAYSSIRTPNGNVGVIEAFEFNVKAEGKDLTLTAKLLARDTIQYNINAAGYLGAIIGDSKDDYEGTFKAEDVSFKQESQTQVLISASYEARDTIAISVAGTLDEAGKLPAGTYKDITASTGYTDNSNVAPSFAANSTGIWYIQSGTLIVSEDGSMTFTGLNSYDKSVTISVSASEQPGIHRRTGLSVRLVTDAKN